MIIHIKPKFKTTGKLQIYRGDETITSKIKDLKDNMGRN